MKLKSLLQNPSNALATVTAQAAARMTLWAMVAASGGSVAHRSGMLISHMLGEEFEGLFVVFFF